MKLLIKNAVPLDADTNGAPPAARDIGVDGDTISFVGNAPDDFIPDETIGASGCIAMPGLVNAHTHSAMTLLRNIADDLPFSDWLFGSVIPFENGLSARDIRFGAELAFCEMIRSGTTAFADMYIFMDEIAEAAAEAGLRANLSFGPITSSARGSGQTVNEKACADFIGKWENYGAGLIKTSVEIHSVFLYDLGAVRAAAALAGELRAGVHIHVSESLSEQNAIREKYGMTPTETCLDCGILDIPAIAAHCVHVSESDIKILADKKASAIHNPSSNLKLGNGIAPVLKLAAAGVNVALGTDSCASNNNLNMFEELHLAAILHKGANADAAALPAAEAIRMATVNGALALGFYDAGLLRPGCKADIIIIETNRPHLAPLGKAAPAVAYSAQAQDVRDVIVNGKILMRNRELKTLDEEKAMDYAKRRRGEEIFTPDIPRR